jgi:hypothetical protein
MDVQTTRAQMHSAGGKATATLELITTPSRPRGRWEVHVVVPRRPAGYQGQRDTFEAAQQLAVEALRLADLLVEADAAANLAHIGLQTCLTARPTPEIQPARGDEPPF